MDAPDTVVWSADRAGWPPESLTAYLAAAPDRAFLETMLDRYETLDYLVDRAWNPGSSGAVRGLAWRRDRKADASRARVTELLRAEFGERYAPTVAERYRLATLALRDAPAADYERRLYGLLLDHHRETLALVERVRPGLERREVRALAERLEAYHRQELAELERQRAAP
jgi:hypothetical protein